MNYKVTITTHTTHEMYVAADSPEEAERRALVAWRASERTDGIPYSVEATAEAEEVTL